MDSFLTEINRKEITDIGRTSLHKVFRSIGFKYKIENNRKAMCENSAVENKRINFLRKYEQLKCDGFPFIYMDDTWIFSKASIKRIWQDENIEKIKSNTVAALPKVKDV